eukprot:3516928-Pyramimonas_sp.AAC.1
MGMRWKCTAPWWPPGGVAMEAVVTVAAACSAGAVNSAARASSAVSSAKTVRSGRVSLTVSPFDCCAGAGPNHNHPT